MDLKWRTAKVRVGDLKPYGKNPRKLSQKQAWEIKESLEEFGLVEIPVIDIDGTLVAGNQRWGVMMREGKKDEIIEVRVPNRKLTEEEFKKYNLKSNALGGEFDFDMLKEDFSVEYLRELGLNGAEKEIPPDGEKLKKDVEGMELKGFEGYDYLVFVFRDTRDFRNACEKFKVKKVNGSYTPLVKKIGYGRVLDGKALVK
jgi:hypothetical protein